MAARLLVISLCLGLAACAAGVGGSTGSGPHLFGPWKPLAPADAGVRFAVPSPPEAIAARERVAEDGVRVLEAVLANDTADYEENKVVVAVRETPDGRPLSIDDELVTFTFDPAIVDRNAALLLKGARRVSEPHARRNRYGRYYYLAAEYPGSSRCVYAWQRVDEEGMAFGRRASEASVQFRFCDGDRTVDEMVEMFDSVVLEL